MDKQTAYMLGKVFKLGMIYAKGKAHRQIVNDSKLTKDEAKWITVHPNGKENKGRPALIDSTTGQVLGGMGGKFNGKHISKAHNSSKTENKKTANKSIKEQNTKKSITEYEKAQNDIKNQLKGLTKEELISLRDRINKTDANELIKKEKPLTEYEKAQKEISEQLKGFSKEKLKALKDKIDKTNANELIKKEKRLTEYEKAQNEIQNQLKGLSKEKIKNLSDMLNQKDLAGK